MKKLYVRFCGKVSFRRPLGNGEFRGASSTGPSKEKTWVIYSKDRSRPECDIPSQIANGENAATSDINDV
jgi:hypothetical protein